MKGGREADLPNEDGETLDGAGLLTVDVVEEVEAGGAAAVPQVLHLPINPFPLNPWVLLPRPLTLVLSCTISRTDI